MGLFSFLTGNNNNNVQLVQAIKDGALLVDVRSPAEFRSGSVTGAINIPLDTITQQLSRFKGAKNIVVFCRSGNRSRMAEQILKQNGYTMVINGGTWQQVRQAQSN
jgi:rhodanese-related sulfurtransferase